ncbi:MAG: polysaccharide biosynthesis/export family protein [Chlamydiales bacterium]
MRYLLFSLLFLCTACCSPCGYKYHKEGAQEFVLDSYKIKQGKFSILELEGDEVDCLPPHFLQEYEDQIDEDDVLKIMIFHPTREDLAETVSTLGSKIGYRVVNGAITLPHLGPVTIKGLTFTEAKTRLEKLYGEQISNTEVYLEYVERNRSKVALIGEVDLSEVPINGRIRLFEVLSLARVSPTANFFKSYVVRDNAILPIDLSKLVHQADMTQNIVMRPGDKVYIANPMASTVMVMGEVGLAKVVPVPTGSLSLREALAHAGGIPFTGDKRCIQVIRGNILNPKIYRLSWNHITYLPNDSLLLMPGDTVYISEKPITKWNRFIDQLLPSSLLIDLGVKAKGVCGW